jgi:hypothetical protein
MKTLNVKRVSKSRLEKKWGGTLPRLYPETLYIRCNAKGEVNWEKALVYKFSELVARGDYIIHQ